jgi:hypothetical protein
MDSSFGILDAFAFIVFAVLIAVAVVIVVSLGKLPGQLARKWGHPQAAAINALSWIGIATGGLLWPIAFVWAFIVRPTPEAGEIRDGQQLRGTREPQVAAEPPAALRKPASNREARA